VTPRVALKAPLRGDERVLRVNTADLKDAKALLDEVH
jgi:hypothetical protein